VIFSYDGAEIQTITKQGKEKEKLVYVIHYNQCLGGTSEKVQLLQMGCSREKENE
jgi:hypothetical protein